MVAVQALAKENASLKAALLSQNAELKARLDALERTVATGSSKQ